jgi:hypothetical protein
MLIFNSLRALNFRDHPVSAVHPAERLSIDAQWAVRGSSGYAGVLVTESLEYPSGESWKPLGSPLQTSFDVSNGAHDYRFTFVPGGTYDALRIVVSLSLGGQTQARTVTVQIQR